MLGERVDNLRVCLPTDKNFGHYYLHAKDIFGLDIDYTTLAYSRKKRRVSAGSARFWLNLIADVIAMAYTSAVAIATNQECMEIASRSLP